MFAYFFQILSENMNARIASVAKKKTMTSVLAEKMMANVSLQTPIFFMESTLLPLLIVSFYVKIQQDVAITLFTTPLMKKLIIYACYFHHVTISYLVQPAVMLVS